MVPNHAKHHIRFAIYLTGFSVSEIRKTYEELLKRLPKRLEILTNILLPTVIDGFTVKHPVLFTKSY